MSADRGLKDDSPDRVYEQCTVTQCMIDITEKQLNSLRTLCSTTDGITQKEICESESKLIKLFSKQLIGKIRLRKTYKDALPVKLEEFPNSGQFLSIVGFDKDTVEGLLNRGMTLENLLEMRATGVERLLSRFNADVDCILMLNAALKNLRLWTDHQLAEEISAAPDIQLHWSTYKSASSSPYGGNSPNFSYMQRPSTSSLPADTYAPLSPASPGSPPQSTPSSPFFDCEPKRRMTPPATPPLVKPSKGKFPTTPPPQKKNKLYPDVFHPLIKSKSHESQLSVKITQDNSDGSNLEALSPRKKSSDSPFDSFSRIPSGQSSPLTSPKWSPPFTGHELVTSPMTPADDVHPNKS
ncbi:hypothetical protein CAPTEDRAFT_214930 [Capitella teleta]|uniref:SAM domain-containing protein n=1 Tax=Capitella teleta TaxID=283909 RepID=R7UUP7_CAPTE|nr:hypothetical protein CAPTEDRAFT_214930 [Capitella teleta]|eukprot:ELU07086.1 hypothetical protein CAPTEDRAFT_214930 [Capitella teleta]